jgi:hypothetical protein
MKESSTTSEVVCMAVKSKLEGIEEISRFAFPRAEGKELEEKIAFVEEIFRMRLADRSREFYELFRKKGLNQDSVDEAVAYIAVINCFEPKRARAVMTKSKAEPFYLSHGICAAAVIGDREFLEKQLRVPYHSEAVKEVCRYLLERV